MSTDNGQRHHPGGEVTVINELRTHEPCVPTAQVEARRRGLLSVDCCQLSFSY